MAWENTPAGNWEISNNIGVCSKHFVDDDHISFFSAKNERGYRRKSGDPSTRPWLKDDAFPTGFPGCPKTAL